MDKITVGLEDDLIQPQNAESVKPYEGSDMLVGCAWNVPSQFRDMPFDGIMGIRSPSNTASKILSLQDAFRLNNQVDNN